MPRKKGWKTPDEIREKIQGSQLINALQNHVKKDNLSASQVNAANVLLKKVIPDLKQTEHSGSLEITSSAMQEILSGIHK